MNGTMVVSFAKSIFQKSNRGVAVLALAVLALDQFTKWLVLRSLGEGGGASDDSRIFQIRGPGQHRHGGGD
jgi:lipoprotein signal peptidase